MDQIRDRPSPAELGRADARTPPFDFPSDYRYGSTRAVESLSGIAAPLLAAASLATIGVILQAPDKLAAPDWAVLLLLCATAALILSVQCGFWARNYAVTPSEIAEWWPAVDAELRWQRVRRAQWVSMARYRRWANWGRTSYSVGLLFLWAALATAIMPAGAKNQTAVRWVAFAIAFLAGVFELVWILIVRATEESLLRRVLDSATRGRAGKLRHWLLGPHLGQLPAWQRPDGIDPYSDGRE